MKRRKRQRKSRSDLRPGRNIGGNVTQAVLAYDIARYSTETVCYRIATMQRAAAGPMDPELFMMVAEKMLAASEAAAIAIRQIVPLQRLWTRAWFSQVSALQQAWQPETMRYDVGRTFADIAQNWLKGDRLLDAAASSHMKPIHRTVKGNARRLETMRMH